MLFRRNRLEAPRGFPASGVGRRRLASQRELLKAGGLFMGSETICGRKCVRGCPRCVQQKKQVKAFTICLFEWLNPKEFEAASALTIPLFGLVVLSRRLRQ